MASPAEIANDMAAQAAHYRKALKKQPAIAQGCEDAARMIRAYLAGDPVDGRAYYGLHRRLLDLEINRGCIQAGLDGKMTRARLTLEQLHAAARGAK